MRDIIVEPQSQLAKRKGPVPGSQQAVLAADMPPVPVLLYQDQTNTQQLETLLLPSLRPPMLLPSLILNPQPLSALRRVSEPARAQGPQHVSTERRAAAQTSR
eukprot:1120300-Rhodomonas_salina.2